MNGVNVQLWPTPICIPNIPEGTGNCDPGPAGTIQFCDSADPNDSGSPGLCVSISTPQQAGVGNGVCLPSCTFGTDGSAEQGCAGHDTCINYTFLVDPTTNDALGFGFCQGTCQIDADCNALGGSWACQTDLGFCTTSKRTRTKAIGAACTNSGTSSDSSTGACNCFSNSGVTAGYCTSSCVVGHQVCPNGYVCDALEQTALTFAGAGPDGSDLILAGPSTQNPGLAGTCFRQCSLDEAGALDAGACSPSSMCIAGTLAGPDCQPM